MQRTAYGQEWSASADPCVGRTLPKMIRFETVRFHINTGPSELFERVRQMEQRALERLGEVMSREFGEDRAAPGGRRRRTVPDS